MLNCTRISVLVAVTVAVILGFFDGDYLRTLDNAKNSFPAFLSGTEPIHWGFATPGEVQIHEGAAYSPGNVV